MFAIFAVDVGDEDVVAVVDFIIKTVVKVGIVICYPLSGLLTPSGG
jgi:hypothetical protein